MSDDEDGSGADEVLVSQDEYNKDDVEVSLGVEEIMDTIPTIFMFILLKKEISTLQVDFFVF